VIDHLIFVLIGITLWFMLGVFYTCWVAVFKPATLVRNEKFRYDLAFATTLLWFPSLVFQLVKLALSIPARIALKGAKTVKLIAG